MEKFFTAIVSKLSFSALLLLISSSDDFARMILICLFRVFSVASGNLPHWVAVILWPMSIFQSRRFIDCWQRCYRKMKWKRCREQNFIEFLCARSRLTQNLTEYVMNSIPFNPVWRLIQSIYAIKFTFFHMTRFCKWQRSLRPFLSIYDNLFKVIEKCAFNKFLENLINF